MNAPLKLVLIASALLNFGCATVPHARLTGDPGVLLAADRSAVDSHPSLDPASAKGQIGTASYYHPGLVGRRTASGEVYSDRALTAAHRTLDLGTRVRVTNLENSRSVIVRVNDRGPYAQGRIIDLSRRAARALGFVHEGLARVRVQPLT